MFCAMCGSEMNDSDKVCAYCGWKNNRAIDEKLQDNETIIGNSSSSNEDKEVNKPAKKSHVTIIIIISVCVCITLLIIALIGTFVYRNSEGYKFGQATKYIENGDYVEGLEYISDVYTPKAEAFRAYVDVVNAKDEFIYSFENDMGGNGLIYESTDLPYSKMLDFVSAVEKFENNNRDYLYSLPESIRNEYEYYYDVYDFYYSNMDSMWSEFYDVQYIFLNELYCNTHDTFTLNELDGNRQISVTAYNALENKINNVEDIRPDTVDGYVDLDNDTFSSFMYTYNVFMENCLDERQYTQDTIDRAEAKNFTWYEDLYRVEPDYDHYGYVSYELNYIYGTEDISTNADTMSYSFKVTLMAYFLQYEM